MKCTQCGSEMVMSRGPHRWVTSGLSNVVLQDVEIARCPKCGEESVGIHRIGDVLRAVVEALAVKESRLTGEEVRFLRNYLGWERQQFADAFNVAPPTVSRWENDKEKMSQHADKLLRMLAVHHREDDEAEAERVAKIGSKDASSAPIFLAETNGAWRAQQE